jgi:uncharacterized membrane protein YGL010W
VGRLAVLLASYAAYHRDPLNRLTHFVGVPMIVFASMIPMSLARVSAAGGLPVVTLAAAAFLAAYYVSLDAVLGAAIGVVLLPMLWGADAVADVGQQAAWTAFGILFALGWTLQLIGHRIEGNRPALLDNLRQILVAPIFLAAEAGFRFGWGRTLKAEIDRRLSPAGPRYGSESSP